jgi:O-succinylbenzoate synthase
MREDLARLADWFCTDTTKMGVWLLFMTDNEYVKKWTGAGMPWTTIQELCMVASSVLE